MMTTNNYSNIKCFIINILNLSVFSNPKQTRRRFMISLLMCCLSIKGKKKLQLARFSEYCEQYFRINFENRFNYSIIPLFLRVSEKC